MKDNFDYCSYPGYYIASSSFKCSHVTHVPVPVGKSHVMMCLGCLHFAVLEEELVGF